MIGQFLTTQQPSHLLTKKQNASFNYNEKVTHELMKLGVPLRPAEVAIIDLRFDITKCYKEKFKPEKTARKILNKVKKLYTNEQGNWSFNY